MMWEYIYIYVYRYAHLINLRVCVCFGGFFGHLFQDQSRGNSNSFKLELGTPFKKFQQYVSFIWYYNKCSIKLLAEALDKNKVCFENSTYHCPKEFRKCYKF